MIDEDRFWQIIAESRQSAAALNPATEDDFHTAQIDALHRLLLELPPAEIAAWQFRFEYFHRLAYRWDIWGAAYWLGGGCSDDGFMDFRSCLVSLGKEFYFQVLENPDSIADLVDRIDVPYMQSEGFQYTASKAYEEKTGGQSLPDPEQPRTPLGDPTGEDFDFEDDDIMRQRFPKLVAKYPEMGD